MIMTSTIASASAPYGLRTPSTDEGMAEYGTASPVPSYEQFRPSATVDDGNAADTSFFSNTISVLRQLIDIIWDVFPFLGPCVIVLLIVLYIKVALQ